ncbi:MAG: hypothetical protein ACK5KN_09430 [Dysgonomonas sp.]|uniref:hypothetical protein n=1 Tax=unclassified Dysgonomonas TaxID=2630389 RepID=UPI0025B8B048|nr:MULTISPECIES: hypothetical protein [unclassified Dysgonomonas]MDR2002985.1 hypothetical protein [Prevotella sp.]HMM03897.1 hypothetical protein [Dysgonomonas sp.]
MNENYNNYKQHTNVGFRIISIFTILLSGYMMCTYFYSFGNATFFETVSKLPTGDVPLAESYYMETVKYPVRDFIYGTLFFVTLIWAIVSAAKRNVRSLSKCLVTTIMMCVGVFLINEILIYS